MPRETKICKVCGKSYEACRTPNTTGSFRWRDVACSRECGAEYLRRIMMSRAKDAAEDEESNEDNTDTETN